MLDESHCSAHTYADEGLVAIDIFTCGSTDPNDVLAHLRTRIDLGQVTVRELPRFSQGKGQRESCEGVAETPLS